MMVMVGLCLNSFGIITFFIKKLKKQTYQTLIYKNNKNKKEKGMGDINKQINK